MNECPPVEWALLFDNDRYIVVEIEYTPLNHFLIQFGFELVDKKTERSIFLTDDWAGSLIATIDRWKVNMPNENEVEHVIAGYLELANLPLRQH